jgi:hypothetical protein
MLRIQIYLKLEEASYASVCYGTVFGTFGGGEVAASNENMVGQTCLL